MKRGKDDLIRARVGPPDVHTTQGTTYTGRDLHRAQCMYTGPNVHKKKAFWRRLAKVGTCLGKRDVGGGLANNSSTQIMLQQR